VFSLLASGASGSRELRRLRWEGFGRFRAAVVSGGVWAPGLLSEFLTTIQPAAEEMSLTVRRGGVILLGFGSNLPVNVFETLAWVCDWCTDRLGRHFL
jgi:hypothetical protein